MLCTGWTAGNKSFCTENIEVSEEKLLFQPTLEINACGYTVYTKYIILHNS